MKSVLSKPRSWGPSLPTCCSSWACRSSLVVYVSENRFVADNAECLPDLVLICYADLQQYCHSDECMPAEPERHQPGVARTWRPTFPAIGSFLTHVNMTLHRLPSMHRFWMEA